VLGQARQAVVGDRLRGHPVGGEPELGRSLRIDAGVQDVETVSAITVHKSQGSQFATTAVVLPEPGPRILTRELLHTAINRAGS
jgi:exodeoxyribonuclease V alpha subunit